jgi:hypothetical protein
MTLFGRRKTVFCRSLLHPTAKMGLTGSSETFAVTDAKCNGTCAHACYGAGEKLDMHNVMKVIGGISPSTQ